jgi:hypothetical protein
MALAASAKRNPSSAVSTSDDTCDRRDRIQRSASANNSGLSAGGRPAIWASKRSGS